MNLGGGRPVDAQLIGVRKRGKSGDVYNNRYSARTSALGLGGVSGTDSL